MSCCAVGFSRQCYRPVWTVEVFCGGFSHSIALFSTINCRVTVHVALL